tara:strand:- start:896 stop:3655 length:2760 start_codon:yes stop_codon:yes gene_type:complete
MSGIFDQVINYTPNSLITGGVIYKGTWSAATNTPTLVSPTDSTTLGSYYVVSEAGTRFSLDFNIGDWVISNGSTWQKVDNTDAVSSVFTRTGAVVAANGDYTASNITNVPSGNISAVTVQAALNELDGDISAAQEILTATVTNAESTAITRGQVVYVFSATGNRISVKLASNASEATSSKTFGVVTDASIAAGTTGLVTCVGTVTNLSIGSFTDGQTVYLGTAGAFTSTKPSAPAHLVYVGFIERANAGNGELYVKIQNGYELDEIHDVAITGTPAAGSFIIRDATNSLWKNATLTAGTNIAVTNADAAVTVGLTGTVAVANGGTGVTTSTGSGNNVLSTSPTITSPTITGGALNGTLGATTPSTIAGTTGTFSGKLLIFGAAAVDVNASLEANAATNATNFFHIQKAGGYGALFGYANNGSYGPGTATTAFIRTVNNDPISFVINNTTLAGTFTSTGLNSTAIGATTPSTGAFTTLSATSAVTMANATALQFKESGGTARNTLGMTAGNLIQIGDIPNAGNSLEVLSFGAINTKINTSTITSVSSTGLAITGTVSASGNLDIGNSGGSRSISIYGSDTSNAITGTLGIRIVNSNAGAVGRLTPIAFGGRGLANSPFAAVAGYLTGDTAFEQAGTLRFYAKGTATSGDPSLVMEMASTGLAVTGTLSTTGNATIGNTNASSLVFADTNVGLWRGASNSLSGGNYLNLGGFSGVTVTVGGAAIGSQTTIGAFSSTGLAVTGLISATTTVKATTEFHAVSPTNTGSASFRSAFTTCGVDLANSTDTSGVAFINFRKADSTAIGSINRVALTNAVVYNTSSDARLKENFRDFTDSGRLIDALKPRVFDWKNSDSGGKDVVGFVAQEEHAADPIFAHIGAVSVGDDDPTTITKQWQRSDAALIPILVAELQSLRKRLAVLEAK